MVYLPSQSGDGGSSKWIDYQTRKVYQSGYRQIEAGSIPCIILVRDGSLIPHAPLAQRTDQIDWNAIELKEYKAAATRSVGILYKPGDKEIQRIEK
jgi:alpha-D-xyloside xylohydrolase